MNSLKQAMIFFALLTGIALIQAGCGSSEEIIEEIPDTSADGIPDQEKIRLGLDPENPDTDSDGLSDSEELYEYNTDPLVADTDGDGLSDGDEILVYGTDPLNPDTDGDGLSDGDEVLKYNTNPLEADTDNDGLDDFEEIFVYGTNPNNPDTDGDGFSDGDEIEMGTDPLDPNDPASIFELNTVNFGFDKAVLDDQAARLLSENIEILLDGPSEYHVIIEAYSDHIGEDQYNLRLSQRRANAVAEFYKANGISEDRIESRAMGQAPDPCAEEDLVDGGCRENRRVESRPVHPFQN